MGRNILIFSDDHAGVAYNSTEYLYRIKIYSKGIKMWLLSQGAWVKVVAPKDFVCDIRNELKKSLSLYNEDDTI